MTRNLLTRKTRKILKSTIITSYLIALFPIMRRLLSTISITLTRSIQWEVFAKSSQLWSIMLIWPIFDLKSDFRSTPKNTPKQKHPLCMFQGKPWKIRTFSTSDVTFVNNSADHKQLLEIYNKILTISRLNLPEVRHSSIIKSIELLGGYLCTLTYFSPLQLYSVFRITDLAKRTKILIDCYN